MDDSMKMEFVYAVKSLGRMRDYFSAQFKDITWAESIVLRQIYFKSVEEGVSEVTVSDIIAHMKTTKSAVSQLIGSLEEKQYIKRNISQNDRRLICLSLTEKGKQISDAHKQEMDYLFDEISEKMGKESMSQLTSLLMKLSETLSQIKNENRG